MVLYDGPLVVLTSRSSASASEIVAGALQDYGRAVIVGDISTHGKGTVQSLNQLRPFLRLLELASADPGGLKVTIRKFYRANGDSTQLHGITPHIVLPSVANSVEEAGEASLKNPLPFDTIKSARFDPLDLVDPYLNELKERSGQRVGESRDYEYVREDIAEFEKAQRDKTVLLNETERIREREEADLKRQARLAERKGREPKPGKLYEITLADVDKPGLPAPLTHSQIAASDDSPPAGHRRTLASEAEEDELEVDPVMDEAQSILLDYIELQSANKVVTAGTLPATSEAPPTP
jgi:carboxyl-terminal processing protease